MQRESAVSVQRIGVLFVLGVATCFAFTSASAGLAYPNGTNALTVVTLRSVLVAAGLAWILRASGVSLHLEPSERWRAIALGLVLTIGVFSLNVAFERIPVPLAILIYYANPALTSLFAWLAGSERFDAHRIVATLMAFIGVYLTLRIDASASDALGIAAAGIAALLWAATMHFSRPLMQGRDSRPITMYMMASGAVLGIVAGVITGGFALPTNATGWIGFIGVPAWYFLAIVGTFMASAALGPVRTSFYLNVEPIVTVIVSAVVLRQYLTLVQLAGGMLIVAAVYLFRRPRGEREQVAP
jgi:drug/metabolite transporter (DMT)-like permease